MLHNRPPMAETLELPPDAREAGIEGEASEPEHVLREITGPSAFGGDRRRFLDLLRLITSNEFRAQYATTTLGFLWTIIRPIVFFGVIFLVLRGVLRFGANIPNYGQMLVVSLILFTYFQESTSRGVRCVAAKEGMVRKMRFPRIIIPLSVSISAMMTLVLNYAAVFPLMIIFGLRPRLGVAALPAAADPAGRADDRDDDDPRRPLHPLQGHGADLGPDLAHPLLRVAGPLPDRDLRRSFPTGCSASSARTRSRRSSSRRASG